MDFLWVVTWICQNWCMDFSELLQELSKMIHGFFWVVTWNCQNWYMDLLKLLRGFVPCICSMYFSPFAKQNQAEVLPRFQSLLKLMLWTKGADWAKVINALRTLCLWKCFSSKLLTRTCFGIILKSKYYLVTGSLDIFWQISFLFHQHHCHHHQGTSSPCMTSTYITALHNVAVFSGGQDVDDHYRGPSKKEKDHLAGYF